MNILKTRLKLSKLSDSDLRKLERLIEDEKEGREDPDYVEGCEGGDWNQEDIPYEYQCDDYSDYGSDYVDYP
jgi:hypothetical protein